MAEDQDTKNKYIFNFCCGIIPGSSDKLAVDQDTGEVTVASSTDFESEDRNYDVIVHVHDVSANPMTVTVVINVQVTDVDDNTPRFDSDVIHIGTGCQSVCITLNTFSSVYTQMYGQSKS